MGSTARLSILDRFWHFFRIVLIIFSGLCFFMGCTQRFQQFVIETCDLMISIEVLDQCWPMLRVKKIRKQGLLVGLVVFL